VDVWGWQWLLTLVALVSRAVPAAARLAAKDTPMSPKVRVDLMDTLDLMDAPNTALARPKRQCTAKSKQSGVRCKRRPIPGGEVCVMHGGKAPQVQESAKLRLARLVDPAITRLGILIEHIDARVALAAARDVLDRNGFKAPDHLQVDSNQPNIIVYHPDMRPPAMIENE
jgi:hypothetical protein